MPNDEIIKGNLEAFLPYICHCVKATDLLKLPYFTKDQRKQIFHLICSDATQATRIAMNAILNETQEPGRFVALKDILETSGYPKVVQMLNGEHIPCDANCQKIVELFADKIVDRLYPTRLLHHLLKRGTINSEDVEELRAEETNHSRLRACWRLLFYLPMRVKDWFHNFIEALIDAGYEDISELLDPDLHKKIMLQRREADEHKRKKEETSSVNEHMLMDYVECSGDADVMAGNTQGRVDDKFDSITLQKQVAQKKWSTNVANLQPPPSTIRASYSNTVFQNDFEDGAVDDTGCGLSIGADSMQLTEVNGEDISRHDGQSSLNFDFLLDSTRNDPQTASLQSSEVGVAGCNSNRHEEVIYDRTSSNVNRTETERQDVMEFDSVADRANTVGTEEACGGVGETGGDAAKVAAPVPFTRKLDHDTLIRLLQRRQRLSLQQDFAGLNNLNVAGNHRTDVDFNIPTDEDDIEGVEDEDIELREYQKELAREGSEGENVIVIAPTNTGKTRVACKIIQEHLRRQRRNRKIGKAVFLVENEALAFQQGKECAERLPAYRTKVISGTVQRDKKQYLKDFVDRRDILVLTAQLLVNALDNKEIQSLTQFSLMVFDECHHTDNFHRFNEIMRVYMDLKLKDNLSAEDLPQIVGLTASLGVGGSTHEDSAIKHMKNLLANMDVKYLCTVRRNKEELRFYENNPDEEIVLAATRQRDLYWAAVGRILDGIDHHMKTHRSIANLPAQDAKIRGFCQVPPSCGSEPFMQWLSDFRKEIGKLISDEARRMLNPCRRHLEVYNKALMIQKDARIRDAQAILEAFMQEERLVESANDTDRRLLELYTTLEGHDFRHEPPNPKLEKMKELVLDVLGRNEDARGIVFVKTRELARALIRWMNETDELKFLNAVEFVGQGAPAAQGGMTKSEQKDVLEYFKGGKHKIIFATSVAEEGLDITKCNLVIRYEHVTNEIVRLQSRGRARAANSKYYVLTQVGSDIMPREERNAMKEQLMNRAVPELQRYIEDDPNKWEEELYQMQLEAKLKEEAKKKRREAQMKEGDVELKCLNCSAFICFASDIRVIQKAHRIVVNEDVKTRLVLERRPIPKYFEDELKFDGSTYCGANNCRHELGGVCEYKHTEFPLIKIKNCVVVDRNGKSETFKTWKKANLRLEHFTLDDLREVVERKRAKFL